ncbi:hypothetical protein K6Y31_17940 [Motilimonas cestriensis]|uniref:SUKH superfamily protein n=1 Tax=Motilimonas cestriensis TaxID=2742685 RepID=A0ABS8WG41_9GAMM|nr:hypothetical protein [Motilimonas cestriensis]MCE2596673.1 hypothetical protein [Motilimonas cestriensis]
MHKLLNDGWVYESVSFEEVSDRYKGFGRDLFNLIANDLPSHFSNLKFYKSKTYQDEDVFAICEGLGHDYGIQLDPDCEVICLWDGNTHIEIGTWSENEYEESILFIKTNFTQ